jgi:hypothetical protein
MRAGAGADLTDSAIGRAPIGASPTPLDPDEND